MTPEGMAALDRIEAHQLAILHKLPALQKQAECHGARLDRLEGQVAAFQRWWAWGVVALVVACALSAALGTYLAR